LALKDIKFGLKLPIPGFGQSGLTLEGTWSASEREVATAWAVYIELSTRIGVNRLTPGSGNLRETLDSLHALFLYIRSALHGAGPEITRRSSGIEVSLAEILLALLNRTLRPMLSTWHPLLLLREQSRPEGFSPQQHESDWDLASQFQEDLDHMRKELFTYATFLETLCDIRYSPIIDMT
jgi:hypothetical protein